MPDPTPAPAPVRSSWLKTILDRGTTAAVVLLAGLLFAHIKNASDVQPVTPPVTPPPVVATPALVLTAKEYQATLAPNFASIADRVASGELADKTAILAAFGAQGQPMRDSLVAAVDAACSANGGVADKAGLAKLFKDTATAMGGK